MNELEWFYNFLANHLKKGGFDRMKETYTLGYWNYFHRDGYFKVEESSDDGFYFVNEGGTVHLDHIPERYEIYELYLNPETEVKLRKFKFQDIDQEWKVEKYSLYNDLFQLYYEKFDTFYDDFLRFIFNDYTTDSHKIKIIATLSWLNKYKERANNKKFYVKKDRENTLLLYFYLDELTKKIENNYLNFNLKKEEKENLSTLMSLPSKASKYGFYLDTKLESININTILSPIWEKLKNEGLIEKRTKFSVFRSVFTYQKVQEKIVWLGDINQLYYLIKLLVGQTVFKHPRNRKKWEITVNCFVLPEKKSIEVKQLQRTKKPKSEKYTVILEVVNLFITLK